MKNKAIIICLLCIGLFSCREGKEFREEQNVNLIGTWDVEFYYKEVSSLNGDILAIEEYFPEDSITMTFFDGGGYTNVPMFLDLDGRYVTDFKWKARTTRTMTISFGPTPNSPNRIDFDNPITYTPRVQYWEGLDQSREDVEIYHELRLRK